MPESLKDLSNAATQGLWYTVDTPWGEGDWIVAGHPDPHAGVFVAVFDASVIGGEPSEDAAPGAENAAFVAELVNDYRSGKLARASDAEHYMRLAEKRRKALEAAEARFSDIAAGRAYQPHLHATTALAEAKAQARRGAFEEAAREIQHQARSMRMAGIPCDTNEIKASTALSMAAAIRALATAPAETEKPETGEAFQARPLTLFEAAIGDDPSDLPERVARFAEEALELAQALHMTEDDARRVLEYVLGRPRGEPAQEFGGTLATLAVLASYASEDLMRCGEADIARWTDPAFVARLRLKRAGRHGRGPLPGANPPQPTATNTLEDGR